MLKRLGLAVLASLLLIGRAYSEDRRVDHSQLVVMTFNAEFMWDGVEPEEGSVDFSWKGSQTEAEEHMQRIAGVIIRSNPDVLNLVEIENLNALNTLNQKFLSGRGYRPYFVEGKDTQTGQDVGLLTRIDPENGQIQRDDRTGKSGNVTKGVSKNYYARFSVDGRRIAVVGLHFLAQPNSENRRKPREAQAAVMGRLAKELADGGYAPIVLGDFNDYDADVPDHINSQPISAVLRIVKQMDPQHGTDDLVNAASLLPTGSRYTSFYDKNQNDLVDHPEEHTSIDHILISPSLAPMVHSVDIPHAHNPTEVSDHYPVVLRLKLGDGMGPASKGGRVVISRLLPNPPGDESLNEEATIKNVGSAPVDLTGFALRDLTKKTWKLDSLGTLNAGEAKTIKRNGQAMGMNNRGDTTELVDKDGSVIDSITYGKVDEDEEVLR